MASINVHLSVFGQVGGVEFRTAEQLKCHLRSLLHAYDTGEYVAVADWHFLLAALRRHPRANEKIGVGVGGFQRRMNRSTQQGYRPAPGFWLLRVDGTEDSFSIYDLIKPGWEAQPEDLFLDRIFVAMRRAVMDRVLVAKDAAFRNSDTIRCPITNREISRLEAHVDHGGDYPFARIADEYLQLYGKRLRPHHFDDADIGCKIACPKLRAHFAEFHDAHARLEVVWSKANMAKGSRGYRIKFTADLLRLNAEAA